MNPLADALKSAKATAGDKRALAFLNRKRSKKVEDQKKENQEKSFIGKAKDILAEKVKQVNTKQKINKNEKGK